MRSPQLLPIAFLFLIFSSCSNDPDPNTKIVSQFKGLLPAILQNDSGLLHGISLGMSLSEVKKNISKEDSLAVEQADYLQYEGSLAPKKNFVYECAFDSKGLNAITLDVFLEDEKNADSLYNDFKNYFTVKYGAPLEDHGHVIWTVTTGKRPARIELEQDEAYMYGKLTIWYYDQSFDGPTLPADSIIMPVI